MPLSDKQLAANRANAQNSTGPNTIDGKSRSRLNALRDGLTGQLITLPDHERPFFEKHRDELIAGLNPQDPMERQLAQDIAWDTWRLNHLRAVETSVYALGQKEEDAVDAFADARTFLAESKHFDLISLYETRLNRTIQRNLATLRAMQAERKHRYEADKLEEVHIAQLHEFNEMPIHASTRPSKNGFIFSNEEIAVAAVRQRYIDTAAHVRKNTAPRVLYGNMIHGVGDSYLQRDTSHVTAVNSIPPEVLAIERLKHPNEFGQRKQ